MIFCNKDEGREHYSIPDICIIPRGPLSANMYIMRSGGSFLVIDPSVEPSDTEAASFIADYRPEGILITHGHYDHIACTEAWLERFPGMPVYMHPADIPALRDGLMNGSALFFMPRKFDFETQDIMALHGTRLLNGNLCRIFSVPGHTPGQVLICIDDNMFSGDMLFAGGVGRCDLPRSDSKAMSGSVKLLPHICRDEGDFRVFPGHGAATRLRYELESNPFI